MSAMLAATTEGTLRSSVYEELRRRLILGRMAPGAGMSTRSLAAELGVSQMPVRDALSRLAAEGAVAIRSKRKVVVMPMSPERLDEIIRLRLLLEPEAAALAVGHIDAAMLDGLRAADAAMDAAEAAGDVDGYIEANYQFHFAIYRAGGDSLLARMIETLWVQFGPLMRVVYGHTGTARLADKHHLALDAIAAGDGAGLAAAIAADIGDVRHLIVSEGPASAQAA